jgi:hypothetical protein
MSDYDVFVNIHMTQWTFDNYPHWYIRDPILIAANKNIVVVIHAACISRLKRKFRAAVSACGYILSIIFRLWNNAFFYNSHFYLLRKMPAAMWDKHTATGRINFITMRLLIPSALM